MKPLFSALIACLLLAHCKPAEQKVGKEEAAKFASDMETAALKRRPGLLTSNIILQALTDRIAREQGNKYTSDIEKGLGKGVKSSGLDDNIYAILGKTGTFEKVKLYEKGGQQRAIFRAFGEEGINYFDMELTKLDNKVGIADMLVYSSGENISKSLAAFATAIMAETNDKKTAQMTEGFDAIKRLMAKGNYQQAKKEFDMLPASVRNTRVADVLNVQISSELDEETYLNEIEKFEKKYVDEPGVQLTLLDLYFLRKDYDKALGAINSIDSIINKDPFLDYYRGLIYNVKEQGDKAIECYTRVTISNPGFPSPYAELMAHYLEKGENDTAKSYFIKYKGLRNASDDVIKTYGDLYPFLNE